MLTLLSQIATIIVYFLSIVLFRNYIDMDAINGTFVVNVCAIVCASWLPLHVLKRFFTWYDPSDYQKVMMKL